jgi:hypothetical protein
MALELASFGIDTVTGTAAKTFPDEELAGVREGMLSAAWTTLAINDLPDTAFLIIEGGGERDGEGKTSPRSLRHFPYRTPSGKLDREHLQNAVKLAPQAGFLSESQKAKLIERAKDLLAPREPEEPEEPAKAEVDLDTSALERLSLDLATHGLQIKTEPLSAEEKAKLLELSNLFENKTDDRPAGDEAENGKSEANDPLDTSALDRLALDVATSGVKLQPPKAKSDPPPVPSLDEMERQVDDLMLDLLSG